MYLEELISSITSIGLTTEVVSEIGVADRCCILSIGFNIVLFDLNVKSSEILGLKGVDDNGAILGLKGVNDDGVILGLKGVNDDGVILGLKGVDDNGSIIMVGVSLDN